MKRNALFVIGAALAVLLFACRSQTSQEEGPKGMRLVQEKESQASSEKGLRLYRVAPRFIKTTKEDCEIRGGEYVARDNALSTDMVDCSLPGRIRRLGDSGTYSMRRVILGSVYDYLYRVNAEQPYYGLYSYVLFPVYSLRAELFLKELLKTTGFVDLTGIGSGNLNILYLPTRGHKLPSLIPLVSDGSAPPLGSFVTEFYDYALARKLLANICTTPADAISDVCATDLSRGPYLFTYTAPASLLSPVPPPYLFLDLSSVHERAFGEFIAAYKEQVKRTDYTDLERIENLRLRLLSIVLTAADWVGPIKGAITDVIRIAKREDSLERSGK